MDCLWQVSDSVVQAFAKWPLKAAWRADAAGCE
jgi:hypothetical protein